ncbi:hypothetical protein ACWEOW_17690 [Monashia sp. NPDC004114]
MTPIRLERPEGDGMPSKAGMPSRRLTRGGVVRGVAVAVITATITFAAACSDQDTVDTIPPPWPVRTTVPDGPAGPPRATGTSTISVVPTPTRTTTRHTTAGAP